jgi:hypothetical protein
MPVIAIKPKTGQTDTQKIDNEDIALEDVERPIRYALP